VARVAVVAVVTLAVGVAVFCGADVGGLAWLRGVGVGVWACGAGVGALGVGLRLRGIVTWAWGNAPHWEGRSCPRYIGGTATITWTRGTVHIFGLTYVFTSGLLHLF